MKNDTDTIEINLAKTHASAEKYFALFDKYIANTYNENSTILLYDICNEGCIELIVNKNPMATYVVYDCLEMKVVLPALVPGVKFIFINNSEVDKPFEYNLSGMKFDCIIMNPPYQRNLHLKILEKAIEHLKDDDSVCVNLSPARWLQDPLAKYKKKSDYCRFKNGVSSHIETLKFVTSKDSAELFNNRLNVQLGIYKCVKNNKFTHDASNKIIDKIYNNFIKDNNISKHVVNSEPNNFACVISLICGGAAGNTEICSSNWMMTKEKAYYNNNKNYLGQTYKEYRDKIIWGNLKSKSEVTHIEFDSAKERENFYNSWNCKVIRYIYKISMVDVNVHPEFLPWMGDAINPRTGLKGYESEWTDEDFYTFFNITPDEQKVIEETMEKYK